MAKKASKKTANQVFPEPTSKQVGKTVGSEAKAVPRVEAPRLPNPAAPVKPAPTPPARAVSSAKLTQPLAVKSPQQALAGEKASLPAAPNRVKVHFALLEPDAQYVSLCGEFNGWSTGATPMKRDAKGHWEVNIELPTGRYQYKFFVDGEWIPDPLARENIFNQHGTLNSVIAVQAG